MPGAAQISWPQGWHRLAEPRRDWGRELRQTQSTTVLAALVAYLDKILDVFRQGLRDLGYVEGQTIALEVRWGEGQHERYPALAADLARLPVDVIVAADGSPARAAQHATTTIPIVMLVGVDPVAQGLVASLAHPGRNIAPGSGGSGHQRGCRPDRTI